MQRNVRVGQPGSSSLFASFRQPRCLRSQPTEARWYIAVVYSFGTMGS
jgi:hypothetical protein